MVVGSHINSHVLLYHNFIEYWIGSKDAISAKSKAKSGSGIRLAPCHVRAISHQKLHVHVVN